MKKKLILSVFVLLGVIQLLHAQKLSLNYRNTQLETVMNDITRQTGYVFIYSQPPVDVSKKVSISVSESPLNNVLQNLFGNLYDYEIGDKKILISQKKSTQTVTQQTSNKNITGVIVDEKNEPVIGATVAIKGTDRGTITDIDGNFSLTNVPENAAISVSYVGYQSVELPANSPLLTKLILKEDTGLLDEVVVVGYGTVRKRDLTGSVASLKSSELMQVPTANAVEALQGRAAGVVVSTTDWSPGANPSILIRGKRSINANNDPLFVIDGIPVTGGMGEISPADIESMEVLKDASATAIYGARGANGVILITTKQGKEGKTIIDYNGYVGIQTIQNKLKMMNGAEYAEYTREAYRSITGANRYLSDTPNMEQDKLLPMFKQDPYVLESILMAYDNNGNYDPSKVRSYDWFEQVTRQAITTDHQLNIRGGNAKTNFMLSSTYNNVQGIMKDKNYERYSIRLNLNHSINESIKIGGQTQFSNSILHRGSEMEANFYLYRNSPLGQYISPDGSIPEYIGADAQMYNPMLNMVKGAVDRPLKTKRFLGSYYVEAKLPIDGLMFRSNLGFDYRTVQDYEYYAGKTTERQMGNSYAKNLVDNFSMMTWENYFTYNKKLNNEHNIGITALQSIQKDVKEQVVGAVQNLPADILRYDDLGAGLLIDKVGSDYIKWSMASFMGRVNYNYLSRYYLTASLRYDGSSRLAEGHKWVLFPSAALAWRVNDESFLRNTKWITDLKLRLGYGKTGNSAVDPYQTRGGLRKMYYVYNNGAKETIGYAPNIMENKLLTWETTSQWNAGIDFGFLNNKIRGAIEFYDQYTQKLLLKRQLPIVSGFSEVMSNVGATRNKGIEITINTRNIENKNFTWSTDWMFSSNKEQIVELFQGKVDDIGSRWFIGHPIDVYYDYKKAGIWQNTPEDLAEMKKFNDKGGNFTPGSIKIEDTDGDYRITEKDLQILGSKRPTFIASVMNNLEYRSFDLSFFLYASVGGLLRNQIEYMEKPGRSNSVKVNYWTPANPSNEYPRPTAAFETLNYISTLSYDNATFLRVRNITLGYTLNKGFTQKAGINKLRFYLSANNPLIFTKFRGIDPEGANKQSTPSYSTWMCGVNITL